MNNLVTVVMPMYNNEATIADSIESVMNQTYVDWELIVVDDGSQDQCYKIVEKLCNTDSRIKLLRNKLNKGASGARQTAIDTGLGNYIAFLDSDDIWHKEKLEKSIKFMIFNDYKFIYTDYYIFKSNIFEDNIYRYDSPNSVTYKELLKYCPIGCLTVVLRRDIIKDDKFRNCAKEDYLYWLDILSRGHKAYRLNQPLSFYRNGHNSLSSNKIKEIRRQFYVIRSVHNVPILESIFCIVIYSYKGVLKNIKSKFFRS